MSARKHSKVPSAPGKKPLPQQESYRYQPPVFTMPLFQVASIARCTTHNGSILPDDVVEQILACTDVSTVVRCGRVSRAWYALMRDTASLWKTMGERRFGAAVCAVRQQQTPLATYQFLCNPEHRYALLAELITIVMNGSDYRGFVSSNQFPYLNGAPHHSWGHDVFLPAARARFHAQVQAMDVEAHVMYTLQAIELLCEGQRMGLWEHCPVVVDICRAVVDGNNWKRFFQNESLQGYGLRALHATAVISLLLPDDVPDLLTLLDQQPPSHDHAQRDIYVVAAAAACHTPVRSLYASEQHRTACEWLLTGLKHCTDARVVGLAMSCVRFMLPQKCPTQFCLEVLTAEAAAINRFPVSHVEFVLSGYLESVGERREFHPALLGQMCPRLIELAALPPANLGYKAAKVFTAIWGIPLDSYRVFVPQIQQIYAHYEDKAPSAETSVMQHAPIALMRLRLTVRVVFLIIYFKCLTASLAYTSHQRPWKTRYFCVSIVVVR
eukprot:TRINITY_DN7364_c0_g1_i2.p1 TRINITY_DN7364_c0_g1~~TRINITY_DN7364_c0_g1_i2.p1  ORF type:complete len:496 (+),score=104.98 TRINITY_DN7364_c0_g1_i2:19-1506(+)